MCEGPHRRENECLAACAAVFACLVGQQRLGGLSCPHDPVRRAENSRGPRHLAEFWMVEPEVAFANMDDIMDLSQDLVQHCCRSVLELRRQATSPLLSSSDSVRSGQPCRQCQSRISIPKRSILS